MRIVAFIITVILCSQSFGAGLPVNDMPNPQDAIKGLERFKSSPREYIDDYTNNPDETKYNGQDIESIAKQKSKDDETAQLSNDSYNLQNSNVIDSRDVERATFISNNALSISTGVSNKYIDCDNPNKCETVWGEDENVCTEKPSLGDVVCMTNSVNGVCEHINSYIQSGTCKKDPAQPKCLAKSDGACIKYEQLYHCEEQNSSCSTYRAQGCREKGSVCLSQTNGVCQEYKRTYECPVKKCELKSNITCGESSICMDGTCDTTTPSDELDFNEAVEDLAVVGEATKGLPQDFSEKSQILFKGKAMSCHKTNLGMRDCCRDKGWLSGILNCSSQEKELGKAKEMNKVVEPASVKYCAKWRKILGHKVYCREWRQGYCVFDSKLSKLIQKGGRQQLQMNFGSGEHPNCRGFSPEELAKIDLDEVNLEEAFGDLEDKFKLKNESEINKSGQEGASDLENHSRRSRGV